jgi:hypothetical protein
MVYGIEKARHLHRLNNGTGEPDKSQAESIGKNACRCARAYESEAGEKIQAAQIARSKVADEHLSGADKFVVVERLCESKAERRDLTSRVKLIRTTL